MIQFLGWKIADPICSFCISLLIFLSVLPLVRSTGTILLLRTPKKLLDAESVLATLPGVRAVMDLHSWQLANGQFVANVRLAVAHDADATAVLTRARHLLAARGATTICVEIAPVADGGARQRQVQAIASTTTSTLTTTTPTAASQQNDASLLKLAAPAPIDDDFDDHSHDGHEHSHDDDDHSHDGHSHDGHSHDGHSHDGHSHDSHSHGGAMFRGVTSQISAPTSVIEKPTKKVAEGKSD
jgi:hypothetical protein